MSFNLRDLRERKAMSQSELARALSDKWVAGHPEDTDHFTVDMVSRMERDTEKIPLETMYCIIQVFGVTFDQLLNPTVARLDAPKVENRWFQVEEVRSSVQAFLDNNPLFPKGGSPPQWSIELRRTLNHAVRKPRLACIGRPDSGKSRTLNTLLGTDVLPANWTPTTSTIIYLKHLSDKPSYMGQDTVWIFREQPEGNWNPDRFWEEDYCLQWKLAGGSYHLLHTYGARQNGHVDVEVGAAVAYVDSEILWDCDLIDLPGFDPQPDFKPGDEMDIEDICTSRDTILSARAAQTADGYIYLSIANSFLYGDDLAMAQSIVKRLPMMERKAENNIQPLGNLFIVASQALTVDRGNTEKLSAICDQAAARLWRMVEGHPSVSIRAKHSGYEYSEATLRSRFFTSEMDSASLTQAFHQDLTHFIEQLPCVQRMRAVRELSAFAYHQSMVYRFQAEMLRHRSSIERRQAAMQSLQGVLRFVLQDAQVADSIFTIKHACVNRCESIYHEVICSAHIVELIEWRGLKKNRRDLQELINLLNAEIENRFTIMLFQQDVKWKNSLNTFTSQYLESFSSDVDIRSQSYLKHVVAFAHSRLDMIDTLAASTLSLSEINIFMLTNIISFGSSMATLAVAAASVGVAILSAAIVMSTAILPILALGGTWKKTIGSRLVRLYKEKRVLDCLVLASNKYWDQLYSVFRNEATTIQFHRQQLRECQEQAAGDTAFLERQATHFDDLCELHQRLGHMLQPALRSLPSLDLPERGN